MGMLYLISLGILETMEEIAWLRGLLGEAAWIFLPDKTEVIQEFRTHHHHLLADEIRFERRLLAATFTIAFRFYIKIPSLHLSFTFPMCGLHKAPRVMVIKLVQFGFSMGDGNTIMVCWWQGWLSQCQRWHWWMMLREAPTKITGFFWTNDPNFWTHRTTP